jgi:hypothetical protein
LTWIKDCCAPSSIFAISGGVDALKSNLPFQIFRTIIALDHTDNRYSIRHDGDAARALAGSTLAMDIFGFRGEGR